MLGDLSAKYESKGNPGTISDGVGDAGGKSYGAYQLSSKAGSVDSFIGWAIDSGNTVYVQYGNALAANKVGSDEFDKVWSDIADKDSNTFFQMQHSYICWAYFFPAVAVLKEKGYDVYKHNSVMQDVVWSRAVQYGVENIADMFNEAVRSLDYPNLSYVDDVNYDGALIMAVYKNVCKTEEWTDGSPGQREGLYDRFDNECADALAQLES